MRSVLNQHQRDRLLALGTALFAASLITAARSIEDSMLSDAVGAGGVPQGVGIAMAVAAVALFAKSFRGNKPAGAGAEQADSTQAKNANHDAGPSPAVAVRTVGLVFILIGYALLLPVLGYAATVSLLVLASGRLAGAPLKLPLWLCAALSGPLLWAIFDRALQVRMPVGSLWG